tara:strand:+ start:5049 stop:5255 length:207 start_codon:yes stop_codon:yes gene_type:complete
MLKKRVTGQQVIDLIGRQKEILSDFDEAVRNQSGVDSKKLETQIKQFETRNRDIIKVMREIISIRQNN